MCRTDCVRERSETRVGCDGRNLCIQFSRGGGGIFSSCVLARCGRARKRTAVTFAGAAYGIVSAAVSNASSGLRLASAVGSAARRIPASPDVASMIAGSPGTRAARALTSSASDEKTPE